MVYNFERRSTHCKERYCFLNTVTNLCKGNFALCLELNSIGIGLGLGLVVIAALGVQICDVIFKGVERIDEM